MLGGSGGGWDCWRDGGQGNVILGAREGGWDKERWLSRWMFHNGVGAKGRTVCELLALEKGRRREKREERAKWQALWCGVPRGAGDRSKEAAGWYWND